MRALVDQLTLLPTKHGSAIPRGKSSFYRGLCTSMSAAGRVPLGGLDWGTYAKELGFEIPVQTLQTGLEAYLSTWM